MQIVIGSQGREALPVFEMLPVHNSLDRILGFKNYTNRCARLARAKHSKPGTSQNKIKSLIWCI